MRRLDISRAARRDLAGIYAYTLDRWGETQADHYLADFEAACARIAEGTAIARRLEFRPDPIFRTRQGRHIIIFRDAAEAVLIVRVLHERMDIAARLDEG